MGLLLTLVTPVAAQSVSPAPLPNAFRDLALAEGAITLPIDDGDEFGINVLIGFDFSFYGQTHTDVTIVTNGYLTFANTVNRLNEPIPEAFVPNAFIAPFWDDLDLSPNPDAKILFQRTGKAPKRTLAVQWQGVAFKKDPGARLSFQVILFEQGSEIQFHYGSMKNGDGSEGTGLASGSSATIGVENAAGTGGLQLSFNTGGIVTSNGRGFGILAGSVTPAMPEGHALGDVNRDGAVNVLDQSRMVEAGHVGSEPLTAAELTASDIAPLGNEATVSRDDHVTTADRAAVARSPMATTATLG